MSVFEWKNQRGSVFQHGLILLFQSWSFLSFCWQEVDSFSSALLVVLFPLYSYHYPIIYIYLIWASSMLPPPPSTYIPGLKWHFLCTPLLLSVSTKAKKPEPNHVSDNEQYDNSHATLWPLAPYWNSVWWWDSNSSSLAPENERIPTVIITAFPSREQKKTDLFESEVMALKELQY